MVEQGAHMDRPVEARWNVANVRKKVLQETERELLAKLAQTRESLAHCERELRLCEDAQKPRRQSVAEETWRRTVRQLGTFTVSELACELGVSTALARKHLGTMMDMDPPMAKTVGRALGKQLYSYCKPTEAGAAFETERRLRVVGDIVPDVDAPVRGAAVAGTGSNPWDVISHKVLRDAVRDAVRAGWKLQKKGDGHWSLWKGTDEVGVASSPSNPTGAAEIVRRGTGTRRVS